MAILIAFIFGVVVGVFICCLIFKDESELENHFESYEVKQKTDASNGKPQKPDVSKPSNTPRY